MKYSLSFLFLFLLSVNTSAASDDFSDKDRAVIYTHSLDIILNYQRLINEMGEFAISNTEAAQSSSESFLELFVNRQVLIYNDLDPTHRLSAFYEAETYVSNLMLWYPDGMKVDLDFENAKVGNIMQHEGEIFSLDIMLTKKIDGNYLNRSQNVNAEEILFRVAFNKKVGGFSNYKIVGIRNSDATNIPDFNKNLDEVNSEEMDENDLFKVAEGMRAVMYDYVNYITLLGDAEEIEEDKEYYRESFRSLYDNDDVRVFNDLAPDPVKSLLSIEEYLTSLQNDYVQGINNISVPVDSAKIGKAIKTEAGDYYATLKVNKFFSGNFQEKEPFRKMFELNVKIGFEKSGAAFINFKIQSIDIEADDFYQSGDGVEEASLPTMSITTISRKGWSVGFEGSYGLTAVENQSMSSLTLDYDNHTWLTTPDYGIKAAANVYYFLNDNMGIKSGLSYSSYKSNFSLDGEFTDSELSYDVNNEPFHKKVTADYDSAVSMSYLSLPIVFNYTSGKPGKIGFYVEAGAVISYKLLAKHESSGTFYYTGYYPDHPDVIKVLSIEELGFFSDDPIRRSGNIPISALNISGYASLGVNISLGYFSSIKIGPEIYYGISDIDAGSTYVDIFGNELAKQATLLKKYSMKISYILKL
ncbi:MAG: porin family protein [Bacteroidales bacterium]|nr:porin family protein [Bacteroidales bacterium]